jgi:dipeptidyl aminopeptidase/acylaminoacyl peptidase
MIFFMKYFLSVFLYFALLSGYAQISKPLLKATDLYQLPEVKDCKVSPDGRMVAYVVSKVDSGKDKTVGHIWMCSTDGGTDIQMTNGEEGDFSPQWSPDGKYLSFVSSRNTGEDSSSLWILDRRGGEGRKLLDVKGKLM